MSEEVETRKMNMVAQVANTTIFSNKIHYGIDVPLPVGSPLIHSSRSLNAQLSGTRWTTLNTQCRHSLYPLSSTNPSFAVANKVCYHNNSPEQKLKHTTMPIIFYRGLFSKYGYFPFIVYSF